MGHLQLHADADPGRVEAGHVHSEVTIESFRRLAAGLSSQFDVTVVEAGSGRVMIDSRRPQALGAPLGPPEDHRFGRRPSRCC
jgi:hypothetical protein